MWPVRFLYTFLPDKLVVFTKMSWSYFFFYFVIVLFAVPSGPPFLIMAQDVTTTTLKLLWTPPEERHRCGIITKYSVCYQNSALRTNCRNITEINKDQLSYVISDLLPNTEYLLQVKAATKVGWGIPGAIYERTLSSGKSNKLG